MFEQDPYIIKKVAKALSEYDNFGLCLDWGHAVLSKTNPQIWAEELKEYVNNQPSYLFRLKAVYRLDNNIVNQ